MWEGGRKGEGRAGKGRRKGGKGRRREERAGKGEGRPGERGENIHSYIYCLQHFSYCLATLQSVGFLSLFACASGE